MINLEKSRLTARTRRLRPRAPPTLRDNNPPSRTVVNLSGKDLSSSELSLLSKGLKFVPKPPRINRFQLKQDLESFGRRIRLREFFYDPGSSEAENDYRDSRRFVEKSKWSPPKNRIPEIETYLKAVERDAWGLSRSIRRKDNLTHIQRQALTQLRNRSDIIIKPADKGSAIVVLSKEAYMAEAYRQLSDTRYYRKLDLDPTAQHTEQVRELVLEMFKGDHISKDTFKYLTPTNPRTARFYHLPKIHKQGNPGRPIVSSCAAPTERISEFVDYYLRPLVVQAPSYIKDTSDFLRKLSSLGPLPLGSFLVTLDVCSLYTNIPHEEGIQACKWALQTRSSPAPPTTYLVRMIRQFLELNNFAFNGEHYLQTQGTAMGTRMAPSYANIFMADLEEALLAWTATRPILWWRYIDDVFAIWTGGQDELESFLKQINIFHQTIKFTAEWSTTQVSFLDTTVILDGETTQTDLFTKPTDTHQYLSPDSCHPRHCTVTEILVRRKNWSGGPKLPVRADHFFLKILVPP